MNNLFNLAKSGLSVAQSALNVVGSNLTNGMSGNYSRREMVIGESGGRSTAQGFFGYGANFISVDRAYDAFASNQMRGSLSNYSALTGRYEQLADIDNMFGDATDNVSVSLNDMFKAMSTLENDPSASAARSGVFNSLQVLTDRFNASGKRLDGLEKSTNTQIEQSVRDINSYSEQLADINKQLERIQGQNGQPPADLLDKRDEVLEKLSEQIGIEVSENRVTGRVDVTLSDGRPLVSGDEHNKLATSPSAEDPAKTVVSYFKRDGSTEAIRESTITKGRLAGLFTFRNEDLVTARNELDQIAFQMASSFNEQHHAGFDADGKAGGDLFSLAAMKAIGNANNTGTANLGAISVTDYKQVNAQGYTISFEGGQWKAVGADGRAVATGNPGDPLQFDGIEIQMPAAGMKDGDSFSFNPVAGAASDISRAITNASEFAAADASGGEDNNNNLKELLALQNKALVGKSTLSEAYSSLTGTLGANARAVKTNMASAEIDLETKYQDKQALSGVDMNEETINMSMFMQYYQANAQMLQTANTLFDSLLAIK